jgi:arabinofuranosyltransferase
MPKARKQTPPSGLRGDRTASRWAARLSWAAAAAVLAYGLGRAIHGAWVCDDAFISFRYAQNLVRGHGLVYNVGEAVEGYSNFLWTMLLALGMRLGAEPVRLSQALGIVCFAGTLAVLVRTTARASAERGIRRAVPLAALGLSLHAHATIFATGGLETSLVTLEMTALAVLVIEARRARDYLIAGLVGAAMAATRPDAPLFYAVAAAVALADSVRRRDARLVLSLLLPGLVLYLPYFLWRLHYYGYLFPNTFYAKGAGSPNAGQGLLYAGLYLRCYYVLAVGALSLPFTLLRRRAGPRDGDHAEAPWTGLRAPSVLLAFVLASFFLVVWTGGDFMFARFLLPVTPLLYLALELLVRDLRAVGWRRACVAAALLATAITWYPRVITDPRESQIVEEKLFYPASRIAEARRIGGHLQELFAGTSPRVVIFGMQAMLAYYAEFPLVIEGATGLTDAHVAHLPPQQRTRIGHGKPAPIEYLRERGVDFAFAWPGPVPTVGFSDIDFGVVRGQVVTYRKEVMDHLNGKPGVVFWNVETYLRGMAGPAGESPPEDVGGDFEFWKAVYFDHNDDPELEAAFVSALARRPTRPPE